MRTQQITTSDWQGVFAVPPLARKRDAERSFDWEQNARLVSHMHRGGITRLLYGGNAFLYHLSLAEYEEVLDWLVSLQDDLWCIPSAGPSFGRLLDQAPLLRRRNFPAVMHLPCGDPRDANGLEAGLAEFSDACNTPLILYLKDETNFGAHRERGLDCVARLVERRICIGIKYAVVRQRPEDDPYLNLLLDRVDRSIVVSGIGERPAIIHLEQFRLPGYTTGSGCLGASLTSEIFGRCIHQNFQEAALLRKHFLPLEDLRDAWGPARVLHAAIGHSGIADCGAIPPFVSEVTATEQAEISRAVQILTEGGSHSATASNA